MSNTKKTSIGGQALIEGLLMLGPDMQAAAMRHPDGHIVVEEKPRRSSGKLARIPILRGSIRLVTQMKTGVSALMRSAELQETGEATTEPTRADRFFERHSSLVTGLSVVLGLGFSIVLFILLPSLLTDALRALWQIPLGTRHYGLALSEGAVRMLLFIGYLFLTSRLKDIRRVWMYHGAEHKTIACYEAGAELKVDQVKLFSRLHPRSGTSFLFLVMLISILIFTLVPRFGQLVNVGIRLLLLPLIAGISFELIRLSGQYGNVMTRAGSQPGLWQPNLPAAEPDDAILEVAIAAMTAVIPAEAGRDDWAA